MQNQTTPVIGLAVTTGKKVLDILHIKYLSSCSCTFRDGFYKVFKKKYIFIVTYPGIREATKQKEGKGHLIHIIKYLFIYKVSHKICS